MRPASGGRRGGVAGRGAAGGGRLRRNGTVGADSSMGGGCRPARDVAGGGAAGRSPLGNPARGERGASIVVALAVLLFAALTCASTLSLALAATRSATAKAPATQGYLAVSGAAALVRDELTGEGDTELRTLARKLADEASVAPAGTATRDFTLSVSGDEAAARALGDVRVRLAADADGTLTLDVGRGGDAARLVVPATRDGAGGALVWRAEDVVAVRDGA